MLSNDIIDKKIKTVGELKEVLSRFDNDKFINFGTERLGFEISAYSSDMLSLALLSEDLKEYLEENDYS